MKLELQLGDTITIPDGCIAQIDGNKITVKENNQFKDGDILISDFLGPYKLKIIMIYNGTRSNDDGYNCYVFRNHVGKIILNDDTCNYDYAVRVATEKEKQELFDYMRDVGLQWNVEEKKVEKIRWRANKGEYYYINADGFTSTIKDTDYISDRHRYNFGNYFQIKKTRRRSCKSCERNITKISRRIRILNYN